MNIMTNAEPVAAPQSESRRTAGSRAAHLAPGVAVAAIWMATLAMSVFSPDMVTGTLQEHLPLAGLTAWLWAAISTGYVLMAARAAQDSGRSWSFAISIAAIWLAITVASIYGPVMVTGTDPTRIPLTALIAPVAAAVATAFVCLYAAVTGSPRPSGT